MVVVSHLFLFLWKNFRGRFDSHESNLPLFGTIYFPTAPFASFGAFSESGKWLEINKFLLRIVCRRRKCL
mgnify:CR=1 FL=1